MDFSAKFALDGSAPVNAARAGFVAVDGVQAAKALRATADAVRAAGSHDATARPRPGAPVLASNGTWSLPRAGVHFRLGGALVGRGAGEKVAAVFSGQGSQYVNMFDDVAMNWPPMRRSVARFNDAAVKVGGPDAVLPSEVLYPRAAYKSELAVDGAAAKDDAAKTTLLAQTLHAQPATVAAALGCYDIFTSAGLKVDAVAGHSLGEVAALHVGGAMDRDTLSEIVCARGESMQVPSQQDGAMAAVLGDGAGDIQMDPATTNCVVANRNSPGQSVISGPAADVADMSARLVAQGFKVRALAVGGAFHSPLMAPAAERFAGHVRRAAARGALNAPKASAPTVFTNSPLDGGVARTAEDGATGESLADAMQGHITSPVDFVEQVRAMYGRGGVRVFVEFGPRNTLGKLVQRTLDHDTKMGVAGAAQQKESDYVVVSVNPEGPKASSDLQLRDAAVRLAVCGVALSKFDPWGDAAGSMADSTMT